MFSNAIFEFALLDFAGQLPPLPVGMEVDGNRISVSYRVDASVDIHWPAPAALTEMHRKSGLWQSTCFELFLSADNHGYHEVNLAPSRAWQVFSFEGLRIGQRESDMLKVMDINIMDNRVSSGGSQFRELRAEIASGINLASGFRLGLAAVLELADGRLRYFALGHSNKPGSKPDFHDPSHHLRLTPP